MCSWLARVQGSKMKLHVEEQHRGCDNNMAPSLALQDHGKADAEALRLGLLHGALHTASNSHLALRQSGTRCAVQG